VDTLKDTLRIFAEMAAGITVKPEAMERAAKKGYATATDLADYLVKKGLPFRDAHEVVAHAVKDAIAAGVDLSELPLEKLKAYNPAIEQDVYEVLSLRGSLNARNILGGTAPEQVRAQVAPHRAPWPDRQKCHGRCRLPHTGGRYRPILLSQLKLSPTRPGYPRRRVGCWPMGHAREYPCQVSPGRRKCRWTCPPWTPCTPSAPT